MSKFVISSFMAFALLVSVSVVHAHGDTHKEDEPHAVPAKVLSMPEMEQMVKLLQQLIAALVQLQNMPPQAAAPAAAPVTQTTPHADDMDEHMDEHHEDSAAPAGPQLVIEIEPHFGKTHAHVRHTDKLEEMFFVDVTIDNEDGIVSALVAKTGLAADTVRSALKYMQ